MKQALLGLLQRHGGNLTIRVSVDHYGRTLHEAERGSRSWKPTIDGLVWLAQSGFDVHVAGRGFSGESEDQAPGFIIRHRRHGFDARVAFTCRVGRAPGHRRPDNQASTTAPIAVASMPAGRQSRSNQPVAGTGTAAVASRTRALKCSQNSGDGTGASISRTSRIIARNPSSSARHAAHVSR
jgi:hypothetical protein